MFEILNSAQSRQADALAIEGGAFNLMETAGAAVAHEIVENFKTGAVLVLCGPGNNGGDGFVIARHLRKAGWKVRVACLTKKHPLASKLWDGEIEDLNSNLSLKEAQLVVDAVFGTGFSGALNAETVTLFDKVRAKKIPVVAVDVPSGVEAAGALNAVLTVTFTRKKPAHVLLPTKNLCGRIVVANIGITDEIVAATQAAVFENHPALWLKDYPIPDAASHKYTRGHALVVGGRKRTGAACLAAVAAQRIGAGLTTIAAAAESAAVYQSYRASLMVDAWETAEDFKAILRDPRKNALVIGPGLGDEKEILDTALAFSKGGVLDADVFTLCRNDPKELFAKLSPKYVLTPHEGEFARLFPGLPGNKIERAQQAAQISNAIVLLKGADTVVAAPDGTTIVNTNAPPSLAIGGSGDVLSGLIAGLMAQGMPPFMSAAAAAWLHAETARNFGFGLTPEDIINFLNQTLNRLFSPALPDA
jgi:hydroxyethylthiazole kinase-like uncharacterized protein yjeF